MRLDVTNEARVHVWYERRFGRPLAPYRSAEHAIATWPPTASSVGVRADGGDFVACAPFGLVFRVGRSAEALPLPGTLRRVRADLPTS